MKRIIASASAVFERFVDQVENHEAVAESVIREVTASAARLKVQRQRLLIEIERLHAERESQSGEQAKWRERAAGLASSDEARALECVRRMHRAEARVKELAAQAGSQQQLADQLAADLADVEARLRDLRVRKTSLAARDARSRALIEPAAPTDTGALFDRWEARVVEAEYGAPTTETLRTADAFEQTFTEEETDAALRSALDEIVKEERS